jgi:tripartite-type tricarboxylate transporter receptor subunit TctC
MTNVPNMLAGHPSFPARTVAELVQYAKANPGKVNFGSSGNGGAGHLALSMFSQAAGIRLAHVPYKGAGPANVALVGGEVAFLFANPSVFMPHIKAGRLRGFAIGSLKRIQALPELPTFDESGYPGFEIASWYGMVAPARTPSRILTLLHDETVKVLALTELVEKFIPEGATPLGNTPQAFRQQILDDTAKWAKVIRDAGIKL